MEKSKLLPKPNDVYAVFGLITLLVYGWGLNAFFRILPSWLNFLNGPEIVGILSYSFLVHFLESLTVLALFILISALLPSRYFRSDFLFRAGLSALWLETLFIYLQVIKTSHLILQWVTLLWFSLMLLSQIYLGRTMLARRIVTSITERAAIFLYVFLPLTGAAFIVCILRNL